MVRVKRLLVMYLQKGRSGFLLGPRRHAEMELLPWREFLARLWGGGIIQ